MNKQLQERSAGVCELCGSIDQLSEFIVSPKSGVSADDLVCTCGTCNDQLLDFSKMNANHWRCLNDSMWSEVPAVKVVAWRVLNHLQKDNSWAADLLEMIYLEDDVLDWAKSGVSESGEGAIVHRDSNGVILNNGDSVVLIKDLNVKGANFVAKRGTAVRNITLVHDNEEHIEGKVNDQRIVILTQYVKK